MKVGISVSIDVTKIDKSRLIQGKKGTYLDLTTFVDLDNTDQYNQNGFIAQSQSKDEREAGAEKPPILGNCKVFYTDGQQAPQQQAPQQQQSPADMEDFGDIPF